MEKGPLVSYYLSVSILFSFTFILRKLTLLLKWQWHVDFPFLWKIIRKFLYLMPLNLTISTIVVRFLNIFTLIDTHVTMALVGFSKNLSVVHNLYGNLHSFGKDCSQSRSSWCCRCLLSYRYAAQDLLEWARLNKRRPPERKSLSSGPTLTSWRRTALLLILRFSTKEQSRKRWWWPLQRKRCLLQIFAEHKGTSRVKIEETLAAWIGLLFVQNERFKVQKYWLAWRRTARIVCRSLHVRVLGVVCGAHQMTCLHWKEVRYFFWFLQGHCLNILVSLSLSAPTDKFLAMMFQPRWQS